MMMCLKDLEALQALIDDDTAMLAVQNPNFFGQVEDLSIAGRGLPRARGHPDRRNRPHQSWDVEAPWRNGGRHRRG